MAGEEGFDLPSAGPELLDWQTSCHRKIPLRNAPGISHPDLGTLDLGALSQSCCQQADNRLRPRLSLVTFASQTSGLAKRRWRFSHLAIPHRRSVIVVLPKCRQNKFARHF
jgi:hypothetical protein